MGIVQAQMVRAQTLTFFHVVHRTQPLAIGVHQVDGEAGRVQQSMHVAFYGVKHLFLVELGRNLLANGAQQLQGFTALQQQRCTACLGFCLASVELTFRAGAVGVHTDLHRSGSVRASWLRTRSRASPASTVPVGLGKTACLRILSSNCHQQLARYQVTIQLARRGQGLFQAFRGRNVFALRCVNTGQ